MTESKSRSAHVRDYFSELHKQLLTMPAGEARREYLIRQRAVFERHENRLLAWALANDGTPNPFNPPLTAFDCSSIVLELSALIHQQREAA